MTRRFGTKEAVSVTGPRDGFPGVVRAGELLFVSGCDGHRDRKSGMIVPDLAAEAERQCENAYGRIEDMLRAAGATMADVVRLDHMTSSQDWLSRRQSVRGRIFGKPAPIASTGVAAKMEGINMLTAYAVAVADPTQKKVLVPGPRFAMENISSAVQGGSFVFLSGIRGTLDPRTGQRISEERPESFGAQARVCYEVIRAILGECGLGPEALLRIDSFIRNGARAQEDEAIRRDVLGSVVCASTRVALPLSSRGEIEVTVLAAAHGAAIEVRQTAPGHPAVVKAGGLLFVGECPSVDATGGSVARSRHSGDFHTQLENALESLDAALARAGSNLSNLVRLEVYLRDIYNADRAADMLRARLRTDPPALAIIGAELGAPLEVKLNAIAV